MKLLKSSLILSVLSLALVAVVFSSCEKSDSLSKKQVDALPEVENNDVLAIEEGGGGNPCNDDLFANITHDQDMLVFTDWDHFYNTLACLEYQVEEHNNQFEEANAHLTDEEIDDLAEQTGFEDWQPLIDFENNMGFHNSRRAYIEPLIVAWLDNQVLDDANDPDELDDLYEELRTLVNVDGKVIIGGDIYDFLDYTSLDDGSVEERGDCFRHGKEVECQYYDGNKKRIKVKVAAHVYIFGKLKLKGKIVNFKKRNIGGWKRARTTMVISCLGRAMTDNCDFLGDVGEAKAPKRRKSMKAKYVDRDPPGENRAKFAKNTCGALGELPGTGIYLHVVI